MKTASGDRRGEAGIFWRRQAGTGGVRRPAPIEPRPGRGRTVLLLLLAFLTMAAAFGLLDPDPEDGRGPSEDRTPMSTPFEEVPEIPEPETPEPEIPELSIPRKERDSCPEGCEEPRSGCTIKGNVSFRTGERIYHLPGQRYYADTVIEPETGERWFCTEREARANGWRKSKR